MTLKPPPPAHTLPRAARQPVFYECGICSHCHPWDWDGDCREDAFRFTCDALDDRYGPLGYVLVDMEDRVAADAL